MSKEETMVERCATAVMISDGCGYSVEGEHVLCDNLSALKGLPDPYGKPLYREVCDCRAAAIAVIDALMEPTAAMVVAGCAERDRPGSGAKVSEIYRAMLSKAKEGTGE
jgi:hypothetical protein